MNIILENIRTFSGRHEIPLRPLTILTGENSSGKTTLLACLAALTSPPGYPFNPRFNDPPYNLGSYDSIASFKGGKFGRSKSFSLGWNRDNGTNRQYSCLATYKSIDGKVNLVDYNRVAEKGAVYLKFDESIENYQAEVHLLEDKPQKSIKFAFEEPDAFLPEREFNELFIFQALRASRKNEAIDYQTIAKILSGYHLQPSLSIAPIRTKPERIYDQSTERITPEGGHIPYVLARTLNEEKATREKKAVLANLERFGKESGLFNLIRVRNLGKKGTDPFQILVKISGQPVNLLDVGYGVSQALPVVIESILSSKAKKILIQQPEVHLHPKAQAALGSFFSGLVTEENREFIIETHSDYIVDRIRQEVASRKISSKNVIILYFERRKSETKVFPLELDEDGNVINTPPTYREFFLKESLNLFNRTQN